MLIIIIKTNTDAYTIITANNTQYTNDLKLKTNSETQPNINSNVNADDNASAYKHILMQFDIMIMIYEHIYRNITIAVRICS